MAGIGAKKWFVDFADIARGQGAWMIFERRGKRGVSVESA